MNSRAHTTWILGAIGLAVGAAVLLAAWPSITERWYARQFAREDRPPDERLRAAAELVDAGSARLITQALDRLTEHDVRAGDEGARATVRVLGKALEGRSEPYTTACVELLQAEMRTGSARARQWAAVLLEWFGAAGLEASVELLAGFRSSDEPLQLVCAETFRKCCNDWLGPSGAEMGMSTSDFARRFGIDEEDVDSAFAALLTSSSTDVREAGVRILGRLAPGPGLRSRLGGDLGRTDRRTVLRLLSAPPKPWQPE